MGRRCHAIGVLAGIAVVLAAGCGDTERAPAPRDVAGPARQVARVVDRLETAVRTRDFKTVCRDLLTPAARERAGGAKCAPTMSKSAAGVRRPRIRVLSINVNGRRAEAQIRSSATGQAPLEETLLLHRSGDGYRVAAIGR